jgi:N-acetylmuramic acid 6-phosphate etherase
MDKYISAHSEAEYFLSHERQFHLGILPTEQSNPKTRNLDVIFTGDPVAGVRMLLSVDRDILPVARKVLSGYAFQKLVAEGTESVLSGKKIILSGCGATGRLSILLESMWRGFFRNLRASDPDIYNRAVSLENRVFSIMTGGDYALIRSVENFEDYHEFGRQQVREMNVEAGDLMMAITEGGETSSVLGTAIEAADRGAKTFLLFNNPAGLLAAHFERSRAAITDPGITVIDMYNGPMAIAGSTRMQAATSEQLIAGAALEMILVYSLSKLLSPCQVKAMKLDEPDYASAFSLLTDELLSEKNTAAIAEYILMEKEIYSKNGLVTYFVNDLLPDIFTDTTERSPTFMLPPFKKYDDRLSPPPWAFVKTPVMGTPEAWENMLGRSPRCLDWSEDLYLKMGAPDTIVDAPPSIGKEQLMKFHIGNENDDSRVSVKPNIAVNVMRSAEITAGDFPAYQRALEKCTGSFMNRSSLIIGRISKPSDFNIDYSPAFSVMNLVDRIAAKLVLNTISTGTMVLMGRVTGNWMSWVAVSNKKLKDRGIRLISEICGISYREACYAIHETIEDFKTIDFTGMEIPSPVQFTIKKIKGNFKD